MLHVFIYWLKGNVFRKEHGTCIAEGSTKYACTCSEFIVYYFIGSFLPCFQENLVILDLV